MPFKCSVPNCEDKSSTKHRFPNPQKSLYRFMAWLEAVGNDHLKTLDPLRVYASYRICHKHFGAEYFSTNMCLKPNALPKLFLPKRTVDPDNTEILPSTSMETYGEENLPTAVDFISNIVPSTSKETNEEEILPTTPTSSKPSQIGVPVLKELGVRKVSELTPKALRLYKTSRKLSKSVQKLKLRTRNLRNLLSGDEAIENATATLAPSVANFIKTQIRLQQTKTKGRRFNLDDKILGIVLYKQSPKCYNFLSNLFALPSRKTNMQLLNRIPMKAGVNEPVFDNLRLSVANLSARERVSILMFDEMSIEPQIVANKNLMEFEGFEDNGESRTSKIADHAMVFLVKGVTKKWKKPLVYTFCQSSTKTIDLVRHIKLIVTECQKAGLTIIATVSDQGCTNVAAINYLCKYYPAKVGRENDIKLYSVNDIPIVHIYDPPHLLKGIRNNLLTKNLLWSKENDVICGKWSHIIQTYEDDNGPGELRTLPRLTESHIYPNKIRKMKVSIAAQVFSHSMASVMALLCRKGIAQDPKSAETAQILKFYDTLFDSVNGSTRYESGGKKYKCAVSKSSGHLSYWREATKNLNNMYFLDENKKKTYPPSLKHWKVTINGLAYLSKHLENVNINYFCPREINQDPLENFFGQLRQHGGRNVNPNATSFKNYFKTLFINNLVSKHSINANCEGDDNINLIENIKLFVTQGIPEDIENGDLLEILNNETIEVEPWSYIDKISIGYVGGFISKFLKTVKHCQMCSNNIISNDLSEWNDLVIAKEYDTNIPSKLKKCTPEFLEVIGKIYNIVLKLLPKIAEKNKCLYYLQNYLKEKIFFNFKFDCEHNAEIKRIAIEQFSFLICYNWAMGINQIIANRDRKINYSDKIFCQAKEFAEKRIKKRRN